jgi:cobalamin synthase
MGNIVSQIPIVSQITSLIDFVHDPAGTTKSFFINDWRAIIIFVLAFFAIPLYSGASSDITRIFMILLISMGFYAISMVLLYSKCKMNPPDPNSKTFNSNAAAKLLSSVVVFTAVYFIAAFILYKIPNKFAMGISILMTSKLGALILGYILFFVYNIVEKNGNYC